MEKAFIFLFIIVISSCKFGDRNEHNLSNKDLIFINKIIPLEEDEEIQLFETNGGLKGFKNSGNFITNKRLISYWIDGKRDKVHSIKYKQIDSLKTIDNTKATTFASYIQVYSSSQNNFKVYVDADSIRTWEFFNKALKNYHAE